MKKPLLILVAGPTGSGKSAILRLVRDSYSDSIRVGTKSTTRQKRLGDFDWEFHFLDEIPKDLLKFSYCSVGSTYAIDANSIESSLSMGFSHIVACTDPNTISDLRSRFPTSVIYVYRPISTETFLSIMAERNVTDRAQIEARKSEIENALTDYATNIQLYDFVVLNSNGLNILHNQTISILKILGH